MVEVPTWLIGLIGLALIIVIYIETKEYKKYLSAVKAVQALASGMQVAFEQVTNTVNKLIDIQNQLIGFDLEQDNRLDAIELLIGAHTEVLTLNLLKNMEIDRIGEKESNAKVLGEKKILN